MGMPNPGSLAAAAQGCICAVMDNHNGEGMPHTDEDGKSAPRFWITGGCPVHAPLKEKKSDG